MSITEKRMNEIQARLDASTWTPEEPWHVRTTWGGYGPNYVARCVDDDIVKVTGDLPSKEDSRLIANAPQDLADLLAEVHRLRDELAEAREVTDDMRMAESADDYECCASGSCEVCQPHRHAGEW